MHLRGHTHTLRKHRLRILVSKFVGAAVGAVAVVVAVALT